MPRKKTTRKTRNTKKTTKRKTTRAATRKKTRRTRTVSDLSGASTTALQRELERRERAVSMLETKRDVLLGKLDELEREIANCSGSVTRSRPAASVKRSAPKKAGTRRGRPRKKGGLVDVLTKVIGNKTMTVKDAAAAVKKSGYKSKSSNFRVIVNQALLSHGKDFKKVGRGEYTTR